VEAEQVIYVDNNATTRVAPEVFEAMRPYFCERYGNPSAVHSFGGEVGRAIEAARWHVADLLGAYPDELVFTSCGTESNNTAIRGILAAYPEKKHVAISRVEHSSVLNLAKALEREGFRVTYLDVNSDGLVNLDQLREAISPDTALVSLMWANNETGVIQPNAEAAAICRERGVVFHTDAVQAVGKLPIDLSETPVDLLSLSGHKIHAPKGVGTLYIRRGKRIRPLLLGGDQERGRRSGTENTASIVGLGEACRLAGEWLQGDGGEQVRRLRDRLEHSLQESLPGVRLNGHPERRVPNTSNLSFEGVEGEAVLVLLDVHGICASTGSACASRSVEPSHVLMAMGLPQDVARGAVRFSLSRYNTDEDIDEILSVLPEAVGKLRAQASRSRQ